MANARNLRVAVDRLALIRAIESKQAQCQKEYERTGDKHLNALKEWREQQIADSKADIVAKQTELKALIAMSPKKLSELLERGRVGSPYIYIGKRSYRLPMERKANQLSGFGNILRMLRMSNKKDVSLTEEQFQAYMDGCPVSL